MYNSQSLSVPLEFFDLYVMMMILRSEMLHRVYKARLQKSASPGWHQLTSFLPTRYPKHEAGSITCPYSTCMTHQVHRSYVETVSHVRQTLSTPTCGSGLRNYRARCTRDDKSS